MVLLWTRSRQHTHRYFSTTSSPPKKHATFRAAFRIVYMGHSLILEESGTTLFELVVVAAIAACILAAILPAASRMLDGFLLTQDARRIKSVLDEAVNEAIGGRAATITFSRRTCTITHSDQQQMIPLMRSQFLLADDAEQISLSSRGVLTPFSMPIVRNGRTCVLTLSLRGRSSLEC